LSRLRANLPLRSGQAPVAADHHVWILVRSRFTIRRSAAIVVALLAATVALEACGSSSSSDNSSPAANAVSTKSAPPAAVPTTIPAGTTLRVGDQLDALKTFLKLAGQDTNFPYKVEYSAFIGGPPMLQAFQAGAIDTGFIGTTPLIFAQAGKQKIVAVAGFSYKEGSYQLVTKPGDKDITGFASLKGKKVAYQAGTAGEAVLLQALDTVGLKLSDVTTVNVPTTSITASLQSGAADAGLTVEPLISVYLKQNPTAKSVAGTTALPDRSNYIIASDSLLKDSGKTAALADYISRLVKSFKYLADHPDTYAQAVYVKQYGLSSAKANQLASQLGVPSFTPIPGGIIAPQQRLADLYQAAGEIPSKVDVTEEFDSRFNDVVEKAQG
jgi:sulfonate transport system substrate-binding protein